MLVNGITLDNVQEAYQHLLKLPALEFPRLSSEEDQERAVLDLLSQCRLPRKAFAELSAVASNAE
eukprot:8271176-Lingulodinium_polyedra.AAC.1